MDDAKSLLKQSYDYSKKQETNILSDTLRELVIKDFDVEQIWQQIELQNSKILDNSLLHVSKLLAAKDTSLWFEINHKNDDISSENDSEDENKDEIDENSDEIDEKSIENDTESEISESFDQESDLEEEIETKNVKTVPKFKKSVVDDDFFKLDEMEQFLRREESTKVKKRLQNDDSESENESIDLFKSDLDEMSDDDNHNLKYDDFFENSDKKGEISENNEEKSDKSSGSDSETELSDLDNLKNDKNLSDDNDIDDNETFGDEINKNELKSSLEVREERLKKKIDQIESAALEEKSWQLKGEITAQNRPINSLLEEIVDFDLTTRPGLFIFDLFTYYYICKDTF